MIVFLSFIKLVTSKRLFRESWITSIYLPNGNPQPGPKFKYKLAWCERLIAHAAELIASGTPVVLAGDYNVVPTPQDYLSDSIV
jgi:exonuclease III